MAKKSERPPSHDDRKVQKLMKRIEEKQASEDAAKAGEATSTLEDYGKKVGS